MAPAPPADSGADPDDDADPDPDPEEGKSDEVGDGDDDGPPKTSVPVGMDEKTQTEMFNAAKNDALRDDWQCMKGPPIGNDRLPGIRYGSSIEMRPLTVVLPCPCAGGVWSPPHADDGAVMDASGMWHMPTETAGHATQGLKEPQFSIISAPPPRVPDIHPDDYPWWNKAKKNKQAAHHATGASNSSMLARTGLPGQRKRHNKLGKHNKASFVTEIFKTYYAGSEPYSVDFGCASAFHSKPSPSPGKRWADTPSWTAVAVATPCPCALGTYSTFNEPSTAHTPPAPDSTLVDPSLGGITAQQAAPWQGNTGNYYMEGNVGAVGAALAIITAAFFTAPRSVSKTKETRTSSCETAQRRRLGASFL